MLLHAAASSTSTPLPPRRAFRWLGRRVLREPANPYWHRRRVACAWQLDGAEPLQAALLDYLHGCGAAAAGDLREALGQAQDRLPASALAVLRQRLADEVAAQPRFDPLATRWSVLASPSMDVPRRTVRVSPDESRRLAAAVVPAVEGGDAQAEQAFLEHCLTCADVLAFMLARRALLARGWRETEAWQKTSTALQTQEG